MAKGRKKTRGLAAPIAMPDPGKIDMTEYSARSLLRDAMEASPGFKSAVKHLAGEAKKLVRGKAKGNRLVKAAHRD